MRILAIVIAAALISACSGGGSSFAPPAQNPGSGSSAVPDSAHAIPLSAAAIAAVPSYTDHRTHVMQTNGNNATLIHTSSIAAPLHMTDHGGAKVTTAIQHNIFVNGASTVWGSPQTFEANLSLSTFSHFVDQYVGVATANRYPAGTNFAVTLPLFTNLVSENQILGIVHAAANTGGHGYTHMYHVFLPPNVDHCFDFGSCYSPDVPSQFAFCAYHSSVTFSDAVGHVLYSVEPYQHVSGCGDVGLSGLPNATPIDDTATTLSHEMFETITDPDPGTGWTNSLISEIGDACFLLRANETLNAHHYVIQPEYSNSGEGCFF